VRAVAEALEGVDDEPLEGVDDEPFDLPMSRQTNSRPRSVAALLWIARLTVEIAAYSVAYLLVVIVCFGAVRLVGLL
jgi:hypothetical protein